MSLQNRYIKGTNRAHTSKNILYTYIYTKNKNNFITLKRYSASQLNDMVLAITTIPHQNLDWLDKEFVNNAANNNNNNNNKRIGNVPTT
jgi:hypothetical protein